MKPQDSFSLAALISAFCTFGGLIGGILLHDAFPQFDGTPLLVILACGFAVLCAANRVAATSFARRHFGAPEEEQASFTAEHRAACDRDPDTVLKKLSDITVLPVTLIGLYILLILGMAVSLGASSVPSPLRVPLLLLLIWLLAMPIHNRLLLVRGRLHVAELAPENTLPVTHALARRAAEAAGIRGKVRLQVVYDHEVTISHIGSSYVVFIGTRLLAVATEEEMYAALLRQFSFYTDAETERRLTRHFRLIHMGSAQIRPLTWAFDLFYAPGSFQMEWYSLLYNPAATRKIARAAASLIRREGCARADASVTVKQEMWEYFDFEWFLHLPRSIYESPTEPLRYEATICSAFKHAMEERYDDWLSMVMHKIPEESFLGVTPAENRALLGLTDADIPVAAVFAPPDTSFGREEPLLRQAPTPERYAEARRVHYLEPMETIAAWEASDKNRPAYEISPVLDAYRTLHRFAELEALCDEILVREPDFAHALFLKGHCRLLRYEAEGIDCIYRAIDINKNYMREGFDQVYRYCRLAGLENELETFRRRSRHVVSAHAADHDDACRLRAADRLEKETALDAELPAILAYMVEAGDGCIDRIFLVRKVISEDFFTSVFVVDFTPGADREDIDRAYTAIFHFLDAAEWQYSLFVYNRETEAAVERIPGSLVWERPK